MLTFFGVLFIIVGLGAILLKLVFKTNKYLNVFTQKRSLQLIFLGVVMSIITGMFFYADAGTAYAVQYVTGGDKMITTQGIKTKMVGKNYTTLSYETSIKDIIVER